jgi:hypothetical protein
MELFLFNYVIHLPNDPGVLLLICLHSTLGISAKKKLYNCWLGLLADEAKLHGWC